MGTTGMPLITATAPGSFKPGLWQRAASLTVDPLLTGLQELIWLNLAEIVSQRDLREHGFGVR